MFGGGSIFSGQPPQNPMQPTQGNGMLGGQPQQMGFGASQGTFGGGSVFGGGTPTQGGGIFSGTGGSTFGTSTPAAQTGIFSGGGSVFGNPGTGTGGGIFNPNPGTGAFGTTTTGGIFGGSTTPNNGPFGQNNQMNKGTMFVNNPPAMGTNFSSGGIFGGSNPSGGLFNATPQPSGSLFGGATSTPTNIFNGGVGQKPIQPGSVFGGQTQSVSPFGTAPTQGGGIFGTPAQSTTPFNNVLKPPNTNIFGTSTTGAFGSGTTPYGTQPTYPMSFGQTANGLGNTTWGVPTSACQPMGKFTPLKPKNNKIDGKHVVKCITLLDENMGYCKNELRIKFICSGGMTTPPSTTNPFNSWNRPQNTPQSTGIFGSPGVTIPQPMTTPGTSIFGGTTGGGMGLGQTGGGLFGGSTPTTTTGGIFGGTGTTTGGGLFGGSTTTTNPTVPSNTGIFGGTTAPATTTAPLFGGGFGTSNSCFGVNPSTTTSQATSGFFGGGTITPGSGLFTPSTPSTSPFGNPSPFFANTTPTQRTSIFTQNQPSTGIFGNPATPNFGVQQQQPFAMANINAAPGGLFNNGQMGTLMQQQQQMPNGGFSQAPISNSDFTTMFLNGLFNSDLMKKMMNGTPNSPFQQLVNSTKKANAIDSFRAADEQTDNPPPDTFGLIPNKYNNLIYNGGISFNQSPYLYSDYSAQGGALTTDEFSRKFMNFGQKHQPLPFQVKDSKLFIPVFTFTKSKLLNQKETIEIINNNEDKDLPIVDGGYTITPTIDELREKKPAELRRVHNVVIENEYGKIKFKSPINLYQKHIAECVQIAQDSIEIVQKQWENKKCELHFKNFGNYISLKNQQEKNKMERKMRKWMDKNNIKEKRFDKSNGELQVEID